MGFFDDLDEPPSPPPPRSYRTHEWLGPPDNVLPVSVALNAHIARTDRVAVWVSDCLVFPNGVALCINAQWRGPEAPNRGPLFGGISEPGDPRLGALLADGRRVIAAIRSSRPWHVRPERPVLHPRGGGIGGLRHRTDLWLWPLPPPGPLTVVFEWPDEGIAETRKEFDGAAIVEAAGRAEVWWEDDRPLPPTDER